MGWVTGRRGAPAGAEAAEALRSTFDINVLNTVPLVPPRVIREELPLTETAAQTVLDARDAIELILRGLDSRLLVVVGPCSIHDEDAAMEYAGRLHALAKDLRERLLIVMRVYFEKPRTTVGWKGLINDPYLNGTFDIATGLRKARRICLRLAEMGLPAGTEMLDPITPQYLADLVSWGAIGARTAESQTHRQMASGLSMPLGWKNTTDGDVQVAVDGIQAARNQHSFLGINYEGQTCIINTRGNPLGHVILRGGRQGPNYDSESIADTARRMFAAGLRPNILVDCSHGNSGKDHRNQSRVLKEVLRQRVAGNRAIIGFMLESNLFEGQQTLGPDISALKYGVSITDACIGWEETRDLLRFAYDALGGQAGGVGEPVRDAFQIS